MVGDAAGLAGGLLWLAFLAGAVIALFSGLSYAELTSMYPKAASEYVYVGRAYGNRLLSFLTEWIMLITELVAAAAVSIGFAGYFSNIFHVPELPVAIALLIVLTIVAVGGVGGSFRLNSVLSMVAIGGLLIVIGAGLDRFGTVSYTYSPNGLSGVIGAAVLVVFAFIGFDNMTNISEETKQPEKTVPRGLLIAVAVTTIIYGLVGLAVVSLVPWQGLSTSAAPLAYAVSVDLGPTAYGLLSIIALLTTLNTVLVLLIVSSRIIYGMGREGALPRILGRLDRRTSTPIVASIIALFVALSFLPLGKIDVVAKITSFGSLLTFTLVNLSLLHLRRVAPNVSRPFKAPLSIRWVSITALLGMISCILLLTQFDALSVGLGLLLPASGAIIYSLVGGKMTTGMDRALHEQHEK